MAFPDLETQNPNEETAFPDEEKPNPRVEMAFPDLETQNPNEETAFPDEEKPNPRVEMAFPDLENRIPDNGRLDRSTLNRAPGRSQRNNTVVNVESIRAIDSIRIVLDQPHRLLD